MTIEENKRDIVKDIVFSVFFLAYMFLVLFFLPKMFLLAGGGIEEQANLTKFFFYSGVAGVMGVMLVVLKIIKGITKIKILDSVLHDPETSLLGKMPIINRIIANPMLLILGSLVFFTGLTYFGRVTQTQFLPTTAVPNIQNAFGVEQQVTETADVGLHVYPASPAETIELATAITFLIIILAILKEKYKLDDIQHGILYYVGIPIAGMLLWLGYHLARYGASETALISVIGFGLISTLLIVLTKSIIPDLIYHDVNNFFIRVFALFSSDLVLLVTLISLILLIVLFIYFSIREFNKPAGG